MHRTFSVKIIDDATLQSSYSSTRRYTMMFAFHVALNKTAQPDASAALHFITSS